MEPLHEHNQKTYENICCVYNEGTQRVAVVQPTGSGKSLLMAKLIEDNPNSRFFVLSTSHKINDQFKEKLDEEMLERSDFNIYCNMPNMKQEIMESLQPDYIFLDEMHRALAKEWSKGINVLLNMYPDAKVLGLSATPIRYLDKCRNVAEELFGGNLACDMSLSQAILDGILPMARYVCGVYSYEKDAESLNKKIEKSCNSEEEKKELLRELRILKENLDKGHGVSDIFKKYVVSGNEKFVVFLKNTTHLRVMKPVIEKWFLDAGFTARLYEVHYKNTDKDKEFRAFTEDKGEGIKLCLSVAMVAEGIHGDIDGVIMLRETISPNMYFQMIGRAFACGKKTIPLIIDLVANSQFISDAVDNFPNEIRREIEKRKEECEKEGKEYEVGFEVDEFIVMDEFMDVISGFKEIEGRLIRREWTEEEDKLLSKYYGHLSIEEIHNKYLLHRSKIAIQRRAQMLEIIYKKNSLMWTNEENEILRKYYPIEGLKVEERLENRTKGAIMAQISRLKLKFGKWTDEEIGILKKYYSTEGLRVKERLKNKTENAILRKSSELNIKSNRYWTEEEIDILKKYYPQYWKSINEFLPNKPISSIKNKARKLNIFADKKRKYKYVYKSGNKYMVRIFIDGQNKMFGTYDSEDEAGRVAMEKAKEYGKAI